jgi:hypothetical protein
MESELIVGEEAEQLTELGLTRLLQRKALRREGGQIVIGPHAELLGYYARSLARLPDLTPAEPALNP